MTADALNKLYGDINLCLGEVAGLESAIWVIVDVQYRSKKTGYATQECCQDIIDKISVQLDAKLGFVIEK